MPKMDFSKRLATLVDQGEVWQSIRSKAWAGLAVGTKVDVCVGLGGQYERVVCQRVVSAVFSYSMVGDYAEVAGVPVVDMNVFAFLEGYGDWVQLRHVMYEHCTDGFNDSFDGVLVLF